jgi:hypothetical protein
VETSAAPEASGDGWHTQRRLDLAFVRCPHRLRSMFGDNRAACRWTSAGVGFAVGGLVGGLAVSSLDLSSTQQGGAIIGGALGGGALGAVVGVLIGTQVCPGEAPATPAPPAPPTGETVPPLPPEPSQQ